MEMINVLKRLAELDSSNPNVENRMTVDKPLATITNVAESSQSVEECGDMVQPSSPHTPANISVSANSGDEVASMLKSLMALAGVSKESPVAAHKEIEVAAPSVANTGNDDMMHLIRTIDKADDSGDGMHDDETDEGMIGQGLGGIAGGTAGEFAGGALGTAVGGPIGGAIGAAVGDVAGTALGAKAGDSLTGGDEKSEGMYANSPEEEIEAHDYGDKRVTPKPQGYKQRVADNPYRMAQESIDNISSQLLREYEAFKNSR